jgi:hypothetical protein
VLASRLRRDEDLVPAVCLAVRLVFPFVGRRVLALPPKGDRLDDREVASLQSLLDRAFLDAPRIDGEMAERALSTACEPPITTEEVIRMVGSLVAGEESHDDWHEFLANEFWQRDESMRSLGMVTWFLRTCSREGDERHNIALVAGCFPEFLDLRAAVARAFRLSPDDAEAAGLDLVEEVLETSDWFGGRLVRPSGWSPRYAARVAWDVFLLERERAGRSRDHRRRYGDP